MDEEEFGFDSDELNELEAPGETAILPGFAQGGVVRRTGIALVHEGEHIVPAPGAEARIELVGPSEYGASYHFPVEISVTGALSEEEKSELEMRIWERLSDALDRIL